MKKRKQVLYGFKHDLIKLTYGISEDVINDLHDKIDDGDYTYVKTVQNDANFKAKAPKISIGGKEINPFMNGIYQISYSVYKNKRPLSEIVCKDLENYNDDEKA